MTVLVFSDSHGRVGNIDEMMSRVLSCGERPTQILFLGDGLSDISRAEGLEEQSVVAVRGNCDVYGVNETEVKVVGLGNYRALMMHGHTHGVKLGLTQAVGLAVRSEVDLLLFGHTHGPLAITIAEGQVFEGVRAKKPLCIFNPGALKDGSFGSISLTDKGILMSHGRLF